MNCILITTGSRPALLRQTLDSMTRNASDWSKHHLAMVFDGTSDTVHGYGDTIIYNCQRQGASASRNIGAGSIPKYRRQDRVMFCDDDVYFMKDWDVMLDRGIAAPCAHPFNHSIGRLGDYDEAGVLSTVCMAMPWETFDIFGPWDEPGGSGGSEDVAFCARVKMEHRLIVTNPHFAIHCGLTSSTGWPIVGAKELEAMNNELILKNGLAGRILMQ